MTEILVSSFDYDSAEYELLAKGIEISKDINGLCLEIGLRLGRGMATMIDAMAEFCPKKIAVSVDCYGNLPYEGREGRVCRLDYTDKMKNSCMGMMYPFAQQKKIHYRFIELMDTDFFDLYKDGLIIYQEERDVVNKYSFVHLDGPHNVAELCREIDFFTPRMDRGAILILDDITPDFFDVEVVERYMRETFKCVVKGLKKAIYVKC
jgi:hypothetical protein